MVAAVAIRRWLQRETGDTYGVDQASVDRVLEVVAGDIVATEVNGGWRVARTAGVLRVSAPE